MLESAGADSTEGFEDVGHSSDARILLADYLIGELREEDRAPEFKSQFVYTGDNKEGGPTPLFWVLGKSAFIKSIQVKPDFKASSDPRHFIFEINIGESVSDIDRL